MYQPIQGGHRAAATIGFIISILVAVFGALLCLGGIGQAVATPAARIRTGQSQGAAIGLAIFGFVLTVLFIFVAIRLEHRMRRHQPAAQAWANGPGWTPSGPGGPGAAWAPPSPVGAGPAAATVAPGGTAQFGSAAIPTPTGSEVPPAQWGGNALPTTTGRRYRGSRRYSPGTAIFFTALCGVVALLLVGAAIQIHSEADRSSLVQHHGIARTASVVSVDNSYHSSRGGGYYTADIGVTFSPPVGSATSTTVRYPGQSSDYAGEQVSILIDPKDARYAEYPGDPDTQSFDWIAATVGAVFFGVFFVLLLRGSIRMISHHRAVSR